MLATVPEVVNNPEFHQIPQLLQAHSDKNPLIITSVRKSTVCDDQLLFGKQYIVDSADKEVVRIHYEHDGSGDTPISSKIVENLFLIRNMLEKRICDLEKDGCAR